jgi:hypothetical protein
MYLEIGFILFLIASYLYFMYQDMITKTATDMWKLGAAVVTVASTVGGVYYLYKNPEQINNIREMLLKKQPSIGNK